MNETKNTYPYALKRIAAALLAMAVIITFMPVMTADTYAETNIEGEYRIVMEYDSRQYTGSPVVNNFYVMKIDEYGEERGYPGWYYYERITEEPGNYTVLDPSCYDFSYSDNIDPGTVVLTVTAKNGYTGTLTETFQITPKNVKLSKAVSSDKSVAISSEEVQFTDADVNEIVTLHNDVLNRGRDYKVTDGKIIITKAFLEGRTGYEIHDLNVILYIRGYKYSGNITVKAYKITDLYYGIDSPQVYNGKNHNVTIYPNGAKQGREFTISYEKKTRKEIGTYKFTAKGKGNYIGTIKGTFEIIPKRPSSVTAKSTKKTATVKWKKVKNCTGYQVQLVRQSSEESDEIEYVVYKSKRIKKNSILSATFNSVSSKKYYRARVRSYKTVSGKTYYSNWKYRTF